MPVGHKLENFEEQNRHKMAGCSTLESPSADVEMTYDDIVTLPSDQLLADQSR